MNAKAQRQKNVSLTTELRKKAGSWLRKRREDAGLSQRELAAKVGIEYYTFISQIEAGRGKVPTDRYREYARALAVPDHEFATTMLKYNDPHIHDMIFGEQNELEPKEKNFSDLETRLRMLEEKLIGKAVEP